METVVPYMVDGMFLCGSVAVIKKAEIPKALRKQLIEHSGISQLGMISDHVKIYSTSTVNGVWLVADREFYIADEVLSEKVRVPAGIYLLRPGREYIGTATPSTVGSRTPLSNS